uniref:Uncharacterized protein n=1 Tax=Anguilla anguilla TaxID=7936 RepID=A0A0E9WIA4_ANGAN
MNRLSGKSRGQVSSLQVSSLQMSSLQVSSLITHKCVFNSFTRSYSFFLLLHCFACTFYPPH